MSGGARPPSSWQRQDEEPLDGELLGEDGPGPRLRLPSWAGRTIAVVVVAVLALVVGPRLLASDADQPTRPEPVPSTVAVAPTRPERSLSPEVQWATRGDLAGDRNLLGQVRERIAGRELATVEEVLWAGRVRGGRAVLVAGFHAPNPEDNFFSAPVVGALVADGTSVADARVFPVGDLGGGPDTVVAWLLPGHRQLLVVARPGPMRVEVSPVVTFHPDGTVHRSWQVVRGADGAALHDVATDVHPSVAVKSTLDTFPVLVGDERLTSPLPVAGLGARGYAGPAPDQIDDAVAGTADGYPLAGWAVHAQVVWSGSVGTDGRGVVVSLTRADGATFLFGATQPDRGHTVSYGITPVPWSHPERHPYVFGQSGDEVGLEGRQVLVDPALGPGTLTMTNPTAGQTVVPLERNGVAVFLGGLLDDPAARLVLRDRVGVRRFTGPELTGGDPLGLSAS